MQRRNVLRIAGIGVAMTVATGQSRTARATTPKEAISQTENAAMRISYTVTPTETADVARLDVSWEVDDEIISFEHGYEPDRLTLVDSRDLNTTSSSALTWERSNMGAHPTATLEYEVNLRQRRFEQDGQNYAVTDDWALVPLPVSSFGDISYRYDTDLEIKRITHNLLAGDTGTAGSSFVYTGEYEDSETRVDGESIRLVVPDHVTVDSSALLERIARAADRLSVGGRTTETTSGDTASYEAGDPEVTAFVVSDPIRDGGFSRASDFCVHEDAVTAEAGTAPLHEYVHTRQRYQPASTLEWTTEASAEYYAERLSWLEGTTTYENLRQAVLRHDETPRGVVLAEFRTWSGTKADYNKGALVLAALDAEIQTATGNRETLEAVFERLNAAAVEETATTAALRTNGSPPADWTAGSHTESEQSTDTAPESITRAKGLTGERFRQIAESVAGTDLTGFFEKYVRGPQTPPVPAADDLLRLTAAFTVDSADLDVATEITLDASVSTPDSSDKIDQYEWDLGDGSVKTGQTVSHAYDEAGEYSATLTVTSGTKVGRHTETITRVALGIDTPDPGDGGFRVGAEIRVIASAEPSTGVDRYEWDFGDGTTRTGPAARHTYDNPGDYDVELEAVTDGDTATTVRQITVQPAEDTGSGSAHSTDAADSSPGARPTAEAVTDDGPGFGFGSALAAAAGVSYFLRKRLTSESATTDRE